MRWSAAAEVIAMFEGNCRFERLTIRLRFELFVPRQCDDTLSFDSERCGLEENGPTRRQSQRRDLLLPATRPTITNYSVRVSGFSGNFARRVSSSLMRARKNSKACPSALPSDRIASR